MISVVTRPVGFKLSDSLLDADVTESGGVAIFTTAFSHALADGDYIYVVSNVAAYNGMKYVDALSTTTFRLKANQSSTSYVQYFTDQSVQYQRVLLSHGVLAVHNPIVYELKSDLYPENIAGEAYAPATVASFADDNGYTRLTLSGNLADATALAWITINGSHYQILTAVTDSIIVINHSYNAADTFPGPVVKYYNNYCINVRVWSGYDTAHPWYIVKPYKVYSQLQLTPDANNSVKFSISEIIRSAINTRNKLDLNTLPNNTDFASGYYIEYFESYDQSNGSEITTFTGSATSDKSNLNGLAINAQMSFKRKDVSHMSDYINAGSELAEWLILQPRMTWIVGQFMDLSFILHVSIGGVAIYINGALTQTLNDTGIGVIRVPLTFEAPGEFCVQAYKPAVEPRSPSSIVLFLMANCSGAIWTPGTIIPTANPSVGLNQLEASGYLYREFATNQGVDHTFTYSIDVSASAAVTRVTMAILDSDCNVLVEDDIQHFSGTTITGSITLNPPADGTRIGIKINNNSLSFKTYELTDLDFDGSPAGDPIPLTVPYCIDVVEECDDTIVPIVDDIRLLEDGNFRLLE